MGKHTMRLRCLWCKRTFERYNDFSQHAMRAHKRNMPRTEEDEQRARLQFYHQDKVS